MEREWIAFGLCQQCSHIWMLSRGSWLCTSLLSCPVTWATTVSPASSLAQGYQAKHQNPLNDQIISKAHIASCSLWLIMKHVLTLCANCCCLDNGDLLKMYLLGHVGGHFVVVGRKLISLPCICMSLNPPIYVLHLLNFVTIIDFYCQTNSH